MEQRDSPRASGFQMPLHSHSSSPFSAAASSNYFHNYRASSRFPPHEQQQQQQQQQHHHHQHHQHEQYEQQQQQQSSRANPMVNMHPNIIHAPSAIRFPPSSSPNPNSYPPDQSQTPHNMQQQLQHHQMQLSANSMSSTSPPLPSSAQQHALSRCSSDPMVVVKRKRGRPRKYVTGGASDANGGGLAAANMSPVASASPKEKKAGKSMGKKAQLASLGATGHGFTPHVLSIRAGEDVSEKITSFSLHGPWAVCVLSANGAISYASLWHSGITSGAVPYEGHFEILSLSGLFLLTENGQRTGGLSVSLAGPDGRVFGGRIAGPLRAASPIQIIVGTFFSENRKAQARAGNGDGTSYMVSGSDTRHEGMPMERMHVDDSRAMQEIEELTGAANDHHHHISHVMPLQSADWGANHYDLESRSRNEQMQ